MPEKKLGRAPYQSKIQRLYNWVHPDPEGWVTTDWYKKWLDFTSFSMLLAIFVCGLTGWLDFGFSWSLKGINKSVFEVLKLPVGIATAELAVLALMVSNYRAAQQQRQIVASESHNNFTNYFKHRDYLEEKLNGLKKNQHSNPFGILNGFEIDRIHLSAFPGAKAGGLSCAKFYSDACALNDALRRIIEDINNKQELIADKEDPAYELHKLAVEARKKIIQKINGFGFKHGLKFNRPNQYAISEDQPQEAVEIIRIQIYRQEVAQIISKVISCGFTEESLTQQNEIQSQAKEWAWNMDRYLELVPMPHKQNDDW